MTEDNPFHMPWATSHPYGLTLGPTKGPPSPEKEFGVCANVFEADRVFRAGAKVWILGGTGGEGWHRFIWNGLSRSGRRISKWAPTLRFHSFRAAWIPDQIRSEFYPDKRLATKEEAAAFALKLDEFAEEQRVLHPNRRPSPAVSGIR